MKDKDKTLTVEQCKLIEENHNLIYDVAHKRKLDVDEHYDILAVGLCKAAVGYDETKGKFSTFAFKCMNNEYENYVSHLNIKSCIPKKMIMSYDIPINDNSEMTIGNLLSDDFDTAEHVIWGITYSEFLSLLNKEEKTILNYIKFGLNQNQIGKKINKTQQFVSYAIKGIRNKWERFNK